jgi:hypothetical protein
MEFVDATFVPQKGGTGRKSEPNPYTDIIAQIALKTDEKTGKPLAKGFLIKDDDDLKTAVNRAKRQLSKAGAENATPVTVISTLTDSAKKGMKLFSFWTVTQHAPRTRKPKTDESVAPEAGK